MGGIQVGQGFDLTAIGLDQAPPAIRALAVTLLEQLKQLSAIVVAGPAAVAELIAGNVPVAAEGSLPGPRVVLPPESGVAQANAGFQAAAAGTSIGAGPQAAAASPALATGTWLALPGVLAAGLLGSLGGLKPTLIESAGSEAFGSPMGFVSADREKSRTPEGGRPSRRRRIVARSKGGGFEAAELEEDPVMDFSDTDPAGTDEAQRLALNAARLASGAAPQGTVPALPGAAAAAAACG